jgi:hypothetical protein
MTLRQKWLIGLAIIMAIGGTGMTLAEIAHKRLKPPGHPDCVVAVNGGAPQAVYGEWADGDMRHRGCKALDYVSRSTGELVGRFQRR